MPFNMRCMRTVNISPQLSLFLWSRHNSNNLCAPNQPTGAFCQQPHGRSLKTTLLRLSQRDPISAAECERRLSPPNRHRSLAIHRSAHCRRFSGLYLFAKGKDSGQDAFGGLVLSVQGCRRGHNECGILLASRRYRGDTIEVRHKQYLNEFASMVLIALREANPSARNPSQPLPQDITLAPHWFMFHSPR